MYSFKKASLALFISGLSAFSTHAEMYFPMELISMGGEGAVDLSQFRADGSQLPGAYMVEIYLNQNFISRQSVRFDAIPAGEKSRDGTGLLPCLNKDMLNNAGVKVELFPALMAMKNDQCVNLAEHVPGAFTLFDFPKMRLDLSVPQLVTRNRARGETDPALWDDGINAALMNYSFSGSNRFGSNNDGTSYFLRLSSGLNLGSWRLRDDRSWNYYESNYGKHQQWQRMRTYAERSIIPLKSSLVVGESTTGSDIFDSLAFRGVQLASDDNMLPDTLRGFAPVVRGIAESNAEVSVSQNGYIIYRTTVSPGAFEITDLSPMYSSGDLEVRVKEASGRINTFTVPYTTLPALQREGRMKYSLTAGRYRGSSDSYQDPSFAQGTLMWGLPHNVTLYGGTQFSSEYLAVQSGAGINMGSLGAVSADVTHANSTLADGTEHKGQSLRFLYAHAFNPTGTTFRLTGYRYSTRGFHTLDETALKTMTGRRNDHSGLDDNGQPVVDSWSDYYSLYNNRRARFEANVSQSLGDYGSVWITGVRESYWNTSSGNDSFRAGYSNSIGPVNYSVNYSYSRYRNENAPSYKDHNINLSLSVPLNRLFSWSSDKPVYATVNGSRDGRGNVSQQSGLSGQLLENRNLDWNVSQGYSRSQGTQGTSGNAGLRYRGGYGNTDLGYSYSSDWQQMSYGISGGALLHRDGLTIGQPLGETSVLVATPGVSGVGITNEPGVSTDWQGYTIKPYASAYRENRIQVNTRALDDLTDVEDSILRVIPTKGAIVRAEFKARRGYRVLMTLTHNGRPLPFGAIVASKDNSSIVADGGQVYLSGMEEKGVVTASWGEDARQNCQAGYHLTPSDVADSIIRINGVCR
ncbi:fimbria/pilus outer membrane usher protein [Scandinavium sp.]|uniref:fimbria/pilus outer membrane usher protein n=1 Tax=Scandinavium sp. TaxID=2830653 RepID=UPI0028A2987D|nr:fimbria/pilus outer membrane usher protein [Scandinavium sp.]